MMRFLLLILVFLLPLFALAEDYVNPMTVEGQYPPIAANADDYGIGDPFVMRYNGMYYMYASTCEERVRVYTSCNLVDWTYEGYCTTGRDVYFAYAPEVIYWRGSFYMITSPQGNGHYILKSDSPLGPFQLITENFGHSIDGSFFKMDDGKLMMLFPDNWVIKSAILDENTLLPAKSASTTGATLKHWTEGPGLFRRGEWYYLTFTGNHVCSTGYQVSFASRKGGPRGNFTQREDATLLINSVFGDDFKGLGHSANVVGPDLDSVYTTYHSLVSLAGPARLYNLDRLLTNGGLLYTTGPSNSPMPVPSMPDVYGDAAGELNCFTETESGYFAEIPRTPRFTQEWNFFLNGGEALILIGQKDDKDVTVTVTQNQMILSVDGKKAEKVSLPEIGPAECLHTLRVENSTDILYIYIDDMRVLAREKAAYTAERIGVFKADNVRYSYLACTAQALGSGDYEALKLIPGDFSAIHALNAEELAWTEVGKQAEKAPLLGRADYSVRIAENGTYCFDLTVSKKDSGKRISISVDDELLWTGFIPAFAGRSEMFVFTTEAVELRSGDYTLTISAEDVMLNRVNVFAYEEVKPLDIDFTDNALRSTFVAYGPFSMKPSEGKLRIGGNKSGFAIFGNEGYTDMVLDVRFQIPETGDGTSGILLRATDVSYYDAQVQDSYFGYSLAISRLGLNLRRSRYGQTGSTIFQAIPAWADAEEGELHIEIRGNQVDVYLPDEVEPLISLQDDNAFTHGMYGFFSTGKELTVLELNVAPLE